MGVAGLLGQITGFAESDGGRFGEVSMLIDLRRGCGYLP